jgi:hypothetical protein
MGDVGLAELGSHQLTLFGVVLTSVHHVKPPAAAAVPAAAAAAAGPTQSRVS